MSILIRLTIICTILILTISVAYTKQNTPCLECTNSTSVIALILARGGSKGILKKNLMPVNGVSLLGRTIQTINASKLFPEIWVSTDEEAIKNEATKYGALVHIRPESVSKDYTTSIDSTREFMQKHKYIKKLALFQCTSVFLKLDYVIKAFELFKTSECVFATTRSFKLRWSLNADGSLVPLNFDPKNRPRRQDWSGELVETGMFYFANRDLIEQNVFQSDRCSNVVISPRDSLEIDTANDLNVARCIVEKENSVAGKN
ncbi:N-acylneuraminate cytidylyltransferase A [Episyrphus balteatus]|uniref:N-acylneuraminate cytidylyltransferase A n=1 Tax=Episyrphus balteatus TaxID=286459 RepID=UPI002484F0AB|nr:N-acylneuraminate cytidylyltransferase A [Episyrphus balteatus]